MKILLQFILIIFSLLILWLDKVTPIGLAVWLLYFVILVVISYIFNPKLLFVYSVFGTILIVIGGFLSIQQEAPVLYAIENRASSVIVLWILTITLYKNRTIAISLQKRNNEINRANRDLESFTYSISHDLKTPLTVIRGFSQSLCDTTHSKLDPEERMFLSKILSESDRMNEIISDLLRLSKIGFQELSIEEFNLSKIAVDSFQNLTERHALKKYDIIIQPEMQVRADAGLMRVLFDNLIGNAMKYSAKSNSPRLEIGRLFEKSELVYFIKDNGVGLDMKKADQIFEPFIRLHSSKDFAGSGVGLSIVRRIIERHNGRIWVLSEIGKGTSFFFTLGEPLSGKL